MTDKANRLEEIMQRTRLAFMEDAMAKMKDMDSYFIQWEHGDITQDTLIELTYKHVHAMKGLALTLSYPQIDSWCEKIITLIMQQKGPALEERELQELIRPLKVSVDEAYTSLF